MCSPERKCLGPVDFCTLESMVVNAEISELQVIRPHWNLPVGTFKITRFRHQGAVTRGIPRLLKVPLYHGHKGVNHVQIKLRVDCCTVINTRSRVVVYHPHLLSLGKRKPCRYGGFFLRLLQTPRPISPSFARFSPCLLQCEQARNTRAILLIQTASQGEISCHDVMGTCNCSKVLHFSICA